ncbi:MAG: MFS transporter [Rhodospirillaceae bacterium]|jgi:MFS transporter, UMF1 family|nr:MFS transporter [Rhodospirillaceae bacterium]MBT4219141.1 MFS transporter [Rhodospirillaceae bacterium]MBT4463645.1 MFS transporter [Rhodospirillaceae bacterium]MBT5014642.1 MFS transporter [Rhodospirillaceae bacterium]MBT5309385.1 MFS transporter [Rhodospirillaceae bacterium]
MASTTDTSEAQPATTRGRIAWCVYDWANSAFPTVIITFVFAAYFTKVVAPDVITGTAWWGYAVSLSALAVAVLGPVFGAIADHGGRRKPWLGIFTILCVAATTVLWFVKPDTPGIVLFALFAVGIANFAFEMGMVFYNAMLPALTAPDRIGRLSGWGWGLGYMGGLGCLAISLVGLVQPDVPWFGLEKETSEHLRATALLVAIWFAVFSLPLFLWTPDRPASGLATGEAMRRGLVELKQTLTNIRQNATIFRFLIARMIYTDGINTLFAFGGIYAAGTFGMEFDELIIFAIGMNVTAGIGAALFGHMDDAAGPKKTIIVALLGLSVFGGALLVVEGKTLFWVFGLPLGLFVGPAQAASRSMMARMAPPDMTNEMFGLYALSGKATAFLGPALLGWVTVAADSQRAGMATVLVFLVIGLGLLLRVPETRCVED